MQLPLRAQSNIDNEYKDVLDAKGELISASLTQREADELVEKVNMYDEVLLELIKASEYLRIIIQNNGYLYNMNEKLEKMNSFIEGAV